MATVIDHVPRRSYFLRLNDGKIAISEGGLGGPKSLPVFLGVYKCGWLGFFNILRPLWRWNISQVREQDNPEEAVQAILDEVTEQLLACNTVTEVVNTCRTLTVGGDIRKSGQ